MGWTAYGHRPEVPDLERVTVGLCGLISALAATRDDYCATRDREEMCVRRFADAERPSR